MNKFFAVLVLLCLSLTAAFGQMAESGTISVESSVTGDILIFTGEPLGLPDMSGSVAIDMAVNQNPATGQITGVADFTADLNSLGFDGMDGATISDMKGRVNFSAKPVKRGSITSLAGAKISESLSAKVSLDGDFFSIAASAAFVFKKFEVDTAVSPLHVDGLIRATSFKLGVKGTYLGRRVNSTVNMLEWLADDIEVSSDLADDNLASMLVVVQNVKTTAKTGAVSGFADSLLNTQEPQASAYKVSGKRNFKTGITQLTLTGQKAGTKGTSAVINVDDLLEVQTGAKLKNTLKVYGYSVAF